MMLTLGEALELLSKKKDQISLCSSELWDTLTITYEEGDDERLLNRPERSTDDVLAEIHRLQDEVRTLQFFITKANIETMTTFVVNGTPLTLDELLSHIKHLRKQAELYRYLSTKKPSASKRYETVVANGQVATTRIVELTDVLYDVKEKRELLAQVEAYIQQAQATIHRCNVDVTLDLPHAS